MIIIIEGADGSGKTTLANQLSKQTKYPIIHMSNPKTELEKVTMMGLYVQQLRTGKNFIFDRCWYSEMAYGPVFRDKSYITYPQMYELERMLCKAGAMIIYCTGPKAALWMRCQRRGENFVTSSVDFDKVYTNFEELFSAPHLVPVVRYEYKDL